MDALDRRIIQELQENFPLEVNPYAIIAENIGIDIDTLWQRIQALLDSGIIRRIGFSIDSKKVGYSSTLVAIRVSEPQVKKACELISSYPQITHSYLRDNAFNIWFTVIAKDQQEISGILDGIQLKLGLKNDDIMDLPVEKLFKLDARFK